MSRNRIFIPVDWQGEKIQSKLLAIKGQLGQFPTGRLDALQWTGCNHIYREHPMPTLVKRPLGARTNKGLGQVSRINYGWTALITRHTGRWPQIERGRGFSGNKAPRPQIEQHPPTELVEQDFTRRLLFSNTQHCSKVHRVSQWSPLKYSKVLKATSSKSYWGGNLCNKAARARSYRELVTSSNHQLVGSTRIYEFSLHYSSPSNRSPLKE